MADNKEENEHRAAVTNRRARFDYEIVEKYEAGIELSGPEVKSLREGGGSLTDCYATVKRGQAFLVGLHIQPYKQGSWNNRKPDRERRLLLHRREIDKLNGAVSTKGMTLVPIKVYFNDRGWAKVLLGLAKGKKAYDKRETIKERDMQRDLARSYRVR